MKQFLMFAKKEFWHILRDRWTTLIVLALPILMIVLFGFGISTDMKNSSFGVFNPQPDIISNEIVDKLAQSEYFSFYQNYKNEQELQEAFRQGKIRFALVFSPDFYSKIGKMEGAQVRLVADATDPNSASTMVNYASGIIMEYFEGISQGRLTLPSIVPEIKFLYNPSLDGAYNTVPGVIGMILLLISAMMSSVSIAREKETGSMELLLVSPLKPIVLILSKLVPYFVICNINLFTILILGHYLLDVPIVGSLITIVILSEIYLLLSLSLGLLISSIANTQLVALLVSGMGMILPVVMLSGLLFPVDNMPWLLQGLSNLVPARWYIEALRKVMIMGLSITAISKELIILIGMMIFFILLSWKRFKIRLE